LKWLEELERMVKFEGLEAEKLFERVPIRVEAFELVGLM
jgi:hypothetical protein